MRLTLPRVSTTLLSNELHILSRFKTLWFAYYGGTGKIWTRDQAVMSRQLWPAELLSHVAGNKPALFIIFVNLQIHRLHWTENSGQRRSIHQPAYTQIVSTSCKTPWWWWYPSICAYTQIVSARNIWQVLPPIIHQSVHTHRLCQQNSTILCIFFCVYLQIARADYLARDYIFVTIDKEPYREWTIHCAIQRIIRTISI